MKKFNRVFLLLFIYPIILAYRNISKTWLVPLLLSLSLSLQAQKSSRVYDNPVWATILSVQVNNSIDDIALDITAYWDFGVIAPSFSLAGGTDGVFFKSRPLNIRVFRQGNLMVYINPFYLNIKMDGVESKYWRKNTPSGIVIHFRDYINSELQIDWYLDGPAVQYRAGWFINKNRYLDSVGDSKIKID